MRPSSSLRAHALCAGIFAALFAVAAPGLQELVALAWFVVLGIIAWVQIRRRSPERLVAVLATQGLVAAAVIGLAVAAPVKTLARDRLLGRRVALPKTAMSLRELDDYLQGDGRDRFPVSISLPDREFLGDTVLRWPASPMSLREFLDVIEQQTGWEYRLGTCGNGSCILLGDYGILSVSFRMPPPPG